MSYEMPFHEVLKISMKLNQINVPQLARRSLVNQSYLYDIYDGRTQPTFAALNKIAMVIPQIRSMIVGGLSA